MEHYQKHFKDKVIYCNCDDPKKSNFFKCFVLNFNNLKIKKLISTHYKKDGNSYKIEVTKNMISDGILNLESYLKTDLQCDGDFRNQECIDILKEVDIVVTNPPFSLFREYIDQLFKYKKKFIIIGSENAITYKNIFQMIKTNTLWIGNTKPKNFIQPDGTTKKFGNICWYTNLEIKKRYKDLTLSKKYHGNEKDYPKYDNYDAIEISKIKDIPIDYDGIMGVPITFIDKYNPEQFEILGITQRNNDPYKIKKYTKSEYDNANDLNARGVIMKNGIPKLIYARILIKHKRLNQ